MRYATSLIALALLLSSCSTDRRVVWLSMQDDHSREESIMTLERRSAEQTPSLIYVDSLGNEVSNIAFDLHFSHDTLFWKNTTRAKSASISKIRVISFVDQTRWPAFVAGALSGAATGTILMTALTRFHHDLTGMRTEKSVVPVTTGITAGIGAILGLTVSTEKQTVYRFK
jgi:hypothetical protein